MEFYITSQQVENAAIKNIYICQFFSFVVLKPIDKQILKLFFNYSFRVSTNAYIIRQISKDLNLPIGKVERVLKSIKIPDDLDRRIANLDLQLAIQGHDELSIPYTIARRIDRPVQMIKDSLERYTNFLIYLDILNLL